MCNSVLFCVRSCQSDCFNLHFVDFRICNCKTASTVSKHRVVLVKISELCLDCCNRNSELRSKCLSFNICSSLNKLVKRRVKKTDCYSASTHCLNDSVEISFLKWKNLCKVFFAGFCVFRNNHLLERRKFWLFKEHVLCAAKTNSVCTKLECLWSFVLLCVCKNIESLYSFSGSCLAYRLFADFISPAKECFKIARNFCFFYRNKTCINFTS